MSSIVNVATVLVALPQSSVAVKVTVAAPVAPQASLNASKSCDQLTPPHASVAEAPPLLANQAVSSSPLPAPSHSAVASIASVTSGAVVSETTKTCACSDSFPAQSKAVQVRVKVYVPSQVKSETVSTISTVGEASQLSDAVSTMASGMALHSTLIASGSSSMNSGAVVSTT